MAVVQLEPRDKIIRFFKRFPNAKILDTLLPLDFRRRPQKAESGLSVYLYDRCDLTRWFDIAPNIYLYGISVATISDFINSTVVDLNGLNFTSRENDNVGHYSLRCSNCNLDEFNECKPKLGTCPFVLNPPPVDTNKIIRQAFKVKFSAVPKEQLKPFVDQQSGRSVTDLTEEPSAID